MPLYVSLLQKLLHQPKLTYTSTTSMESNYISITTKSKKWESNNTKRCMTSKTSTTTRNRILTCLTSWTNQRFLLFWINLLLLFSQEWWVNKDKTIDHLSNIRTTDLLKVTIYSQDNSIHSLDKCHPIWASKCQDQDLCLILCQDNQTQWEWGNNSFQWLTQLKCQ